MQNMPPGAGMNPPFNPMQQIQQASPGQAQNPTSTNQQQ
jgi:hypothetical protein